MSFITVKYRHFSKTLIVTIVMLDQEVTGVQEEGFLREKIKNYLCYSLILGLVVIPEKINR